MRGYLSRSPAFLLAYGCRRLAYPGVLGNLQGREKHSATMAIKSLLQEFS